MGYQTHGIIDNDIVNSVRKIIYNNYRLNGDLVNRMVAINICSVSKDYNIDVVDFILSMLVLIKNNDIDINESNIDILDCGKYIAYVVAYLDYLYFMNKINENEYIEYINILAKIYNIVKPVNLVNMNVDINREKSFIIFNIYRGAHILYLYFSDICNKVYRLVNIDIESILYRAVIVDLHKISINLVNILNNNLFKLILNIVEAGQDKSFNIYIKDSNINNYLEKINKIVSKLTSGQAIENKGIIQELTSICGE